MTKYDVILFGEPMPAKMERKNSVKEMRHLCRTMSREMKDCVFEIREESKPKTSDSIKERYPVVAKYSILKECRNDGPDRRSRITEELSKSIDKLVSVYERIGDCQDKIDQKREAIEHDRAAVMADRETSPDCRAARMMLLDIKEKLQHEHDQFLEKLKQDMMYLLNYVNAKHRENPDLEITIDIDALMDYIDAFPGNCSAAAALKRHLSIMKARRTTHSKSPTPHSSATKRLMEILSNCEKLIDQEVGYFRDKDNMQIDFGNLMLRMNSSFVKRMNIRIARCISEPALAGRLIIDQACDLAKCKKLDINKMCQIMFLLFTRLYFDEIYARLFASQTMRSQAGEFQNRVFQMRDLTPTCIGVGSRFLTPKFRTLRLSDFPRMHMYTAAVDVLSQLNFITCPIDFCKVASDAITLTQCQAQSFSHGDHAQQTGQIVAESEYALSLDELFDISLIVFLLSDPVDTLTIVTQLSPYIQALEVPSSLDFGFTNIKAMCDYIMSLDMDAFMRDARKRVQFDQETDPLNITNAL